VQTLRNNIMASTVLASTAIMLSSLIAVLMTSGSGDKSARNFVFGDRSELGLSRVRVVYQVLLNTGVLPGGILAECAVNQVLQPCKYPHQRALQEDVP
jgi:hypothetical protein